MAEDTVVTPHTDTPAQAAQAAEAERSANAPRIPAGETDLATATIGDVEGGLPPPAQAPKAQPDAPQPTLPTVRSLNDEKRAAITAKWRTDRAAEATESDDADALAATVRSAGLPPEFAQQIEQPEPAPQPEPEPEVAAEPETQPAPQPAPQMVTIKVRGQEKQVSLEEAIALAQRGAATEDTLEQAKAKYKELDQLVTQARTNLGQRQAQPANTTPANTAQPGDAPEPTRTETPSDPFKGLLEAIQFGDPETAEQQLRNTIGITAAQMVEAGLQQQRFKDEGARAAKVVKDFETAHPDIATDSKARAAIEQDIYDQQRADLDAIGVDPNQLRQDGLPATPADIANIHRWYRVEQGMTSLKSPAQMLDEAHKNFLEWKGVKTTNPAAPTATTPTPTQQPRVAPVVHVDRSARRAAIPQQPAPTAAPRPAPAPAPVPQTLDGRRSSIVQSMKGNRAKLRGVIGLQ